VAALILGGIQLKKNLQQPFNLLSNPKIANSSNTNTPQDETLLALKAKDTDKDGLSDYAELYSYNTSPYIADSDSDGLSDKQEIDQGKNPNCPEGKACSLIEANSNINSAANTNTAVNSGEVTAAQLRQSLLAAGVSQTELDQIDDATLLQQYKSIVAEEQSNSNSSTNSANSNAAKTNAATNLNVNAATGLTKEQLQNLTPAEIRTFLKLGGATDEALNQYDDETLKAVFLQALETTLTNSNINS
ncbi:MAG: hypothetical protein WC270_02455, partial [Patescibacteria group bacterium]|jgi:hypothetical protein